MTFENEGVLKELLFQKNPVKPIIEVEAHLSAKLMCFDLFLFGWCPFLIIYKACPS
ncbi:MULTISPECIES: hypothetical protein [unclassified Peribacillus]|uniref:hypothetical protein n=1 Tax=unclassified Peribacillus TaxID=2675266 RepID=UPI0036DE9428